MQGARGVEAASSSREMKLSNFVDCPDKCEWKEVTNVMCVTKLVTMLSVIFHRDCDKKSRLDTWTNAHLLSTTTLSNGKTHIPSNMRAITIIKDSHR